MTTAVKYDGAVQLYRETSLTITEISRQCGVSRGGLSAYIHTHHRELMFRRRGIGMSEEEASATRLFAPFPQGAQRLFLKVVAPSRDKTLRLCAFA